MIDTFFYFTIRQQSQWMVKPKTAVGALSDREIIKLALDVRNKRYDVIWVHRSIRSRHAPDVSV